MIDDFIPSVVIYIFYGLKRFEQVEIIKKADSKKVR